MLQGVFLLVCWILSTQSGSAAVTAEMWHLMPGVLVWAVVWVHGRQRRLAREEREELEHLKQTRLSEEIFEETELDTMRASSSLLVLEKYFVPVITILLSGSLLFFTYRMTMSTLGVEELTVQQPLTVAVGMVMIGFVGFLIGKYAAGLAESREFALLRASGGYLLGNVIACVLIAVAMGLYHFGMTWGHAVVAWVIPAMMGLVGIELVLNLILDIYRPRVPGQERRPPYDSRLLGLFAEPGGVLKTVASTLDYQFGFKVSETWFYHFMERAIVPLLLIQLFALWLLSAVVVVDPSEAAFIETFGKPIVHPADTGKGLEASVFEPGFHLKWPWPISVARTVPAYTVQSIELGKVRETQERKPWQFDPTIRISEEEDVILWRERHIDPNEGYEVSFVVPSSELEEGDEPGEPQPVEQPATAPEVAPAPVGEHAPEVNLARLKGILHFRLKTKEDGTVDEDAAFTYCYRQHDLEEHVEKLAYRALCRIAATQDFLRWIAQDRGETVGRFRRMVQEAADEAGLGIEVVYAGIPSVHPPAKTGGAFEGVVTALEQRESYVLQGEVADARMVEGAKADAQESLHQARGYRVRLVQNAEAERDQFTKRLEAYHKSPLVYMFRSYFDTIENTLSNQFLYVVPVTEQEVNIIDLQERLRPQLLELDTAEE
jgi:regulator of protease activity HflC (stomatin/prohibitin superfamily)